MRSCKKRKLDYISAMNTLNHRKRNPARFPHQYKIDFCSSCGSYHLVISTEEQEQKHDA